MKIYLVRHGQNVDNANGILNGHRDLPLTDLGRDQAHEAGKRIAAQGLHFDAIYASPLVRAFETAEIIATESGNPLPVVHPLLIERNFGVMSGQPANQIKTLCAPDIIETETITYFLSPAGAETFPVLLERAKGLLVDVQQKHRDDESLLLVGHGDMGKMIYAAYYVLPWEKILTQFHFGNSELLLLSPDSSAEDAHVFLIGQHNH